MVQVKAQCGKHDPMSWGTEKLLEAFDQLCKTHKNLVDGHIKKLNNDFYGEIEFDPKSYPNRIGLIILGHHSDPYIAAKLVPEILTAGFPVHVFSLKDFATVASRFDTAGDLITFLEMRGDVAVKEPFSVQDEMANIERMIPHVESVLRAHMSPTSEEILEKTVQAFERVATGKLLQSQEWRYGLVIDDMVARAHDVDPGLPWNKDEAGASIRVAQFLGWLTRDRRIRLGKRIIAACEASSLLPACAEIARDSLCLSGDLTEPPRSRGNAAVPTVLCSHEIRSITMSWCSDRTDWQRAVLRLCSDATASTAGVIGTTENVRRSVLFRSTAVGPDQAQAYPSL
jgi:hypothetical protein